MCIGKMTTRSHSAFAGKFTIKYEPGGNGDAESGVVSATVLSVTV